MRAHLDLGWQKEEVSTPLFSDNHSQIRKKKNKEMKTQTPYLMKSGCCCNIKTQYMKMESKWGIVIDSAVLIKIHTLVFWDKNRSSGGKRKGEGYRLRAFICTFASGLQILKVNLSWSTWNSAVSRTF